MHHERIRNVEERRPCGQAGALTWAFRRLGEGVGPDLSDCLAIRLGQRSLCIWEPLQTKAPAPPKAGPYCCYMNTVIFYHRPYIVRGPHPWRSRHGWHWNSGRTGYVQFDQIQTRLRCDDLVTFEGLTYKLATGRVCWTAPPGYRRSWWMLHWSWLEKEVAA